MILNTTNIEKQIIMLILKKIDNTLINYVQANHSSELWLRAIMLASGSEGLPAHRWRISGSIVVGRRSLGLNNGPLNTIRAVVGLASTPREERNGEDRNGME